jgi:hypothetical protein
VLPTSGSKAEAASSSETFAAVYQTTRCHVPEHGILNVLEPFGSTSIRTICPSIYKTLNPVFRTGLTINSDYFPQQH